LIFGIVPALRLSRVRIGEVLARSARVPGSALTRRTGRALIVVEVALAVVLLAGGGLMIRSFAQLLAVDLGFDSSAIVTVEATPVESTQQAYTNYYSAVIDRIRAMPGIVAVGATDSLPLAGGYAVLAIDVEGRRESIEVQQTAGRYIEAMGVPVVAGRSLDVDTAGPPQVVLNEAGARQLFGTTSPIGRQVTIGNVTREVVGVIGNMRHLGPESPISPEIFVPTTVAAASVSVSGQAQGRALIIVVRASGPMAGLADRLRHIAQETGQPAIVRRIRRGDDWLDAAVTTPRQRTVLLGTLGAMGLMLALVGIFGTTAYMVARRVPEIGVRMAFGAGPGQVVRAMIRDAFIPLAFGVVLGLGAAALATRLVQSFLFDTSPRDPATFVAVAGTLGIAGLLAAWVPARRAARVDPVQALRAD
jgi:predicted permease